MAYFGLAADLFGLMRPGEFMEALLAYREKERLDRRHVGELVRGATLRLWNLQVSQKWRITDPAKFWAMPWDDGPATAEEELAALTGEQKRESIENMKRLLGL